MKKVCLGFLAGLTFAIFTSKLEAQARYETRCGWVHNPTPANFWLNDKDGTWLIGEQGGYQAKGRMPNFGDGWVETNGHYGYGCACLKVTVDRKQKKILSYKEGYSLPLEKCEIDPALPKPGRTTKEIEQEIAKDISDPKPRVYDGKFYKFTYMSDWELSEANPLAGLTVLMSKKLRHTEKSDTDDIHVAIINLDADKKSSWFKTEFQKQLKNATKVILKNRTWLVMNYGPKGYESLNYELALSAERYISIGSKGANKDTIEKIAESLVVKP